MSRKTLGAVALSLLLLVPFAADPVVNLQSDAALLAANFMPVILLWLVLLGIGRRWLWASVLSASLLCLIYATNTAKLVHLGEPLLFADFLLASQVVLGWQMMLGYVSPAMMLAIFACVVVAVIVFRLDRPLPFAVSLPSLAAGLAGFYLLTATPVVPDELYGSRAFGSVPWRTETFSQQQGLVASLITQTRNTHLQLPPLDKETIAAFHERHPPAPVTAETQPDIVLWLAESFFDPAIVEGVDNCGTLPQWCELLEQGIASTIKVPTYGGNTTRTEFEVLTGVPFRSIGALDFPYTSVVTRPHTSIAQALKQQQYRTVAVHPYHKNFWRREFALPLLGFDDFVTLEGFKGARTDGYWIADTELGDKVREVLQEQEQEQPVFVFAISMEGHGPWGQRTGLSDETLASLPITPAMRGRGARQWREYIYHARHAVAEMNVPLYPAAGQTYITGLAITCRASTTHWHR